MLITHSRSTSARLAGAAFAALLAVAGCSGAAAPSATPGVAPTTQPTPTDVPGSSGGTGTDPRTGTGGGSDPGTGTGGGPVFPILPDPNQNPLLGDAKYLTPALGLINQHPISVQLLRAIVQDDGTALVDLRWWSGVAPCSQLDHVEIAKDDAARTVRLTVVEGSGRGDIACIDLAQLSATTVNLGALATGTWTISAEGDAPAIPLEVK